MPRLSSTSTPVRLPSPSAPADDALAAAPRPAARAGRRPPAAIPGPSLERDCRPSPDQRGPDQRGPDRRGADRPGQDRRGQERAGQDQVAPAEGDAAVALALVQRAQAGDAEAFGALYDRYVDVVYRYISYRVGSTQLAEDLTSETFLRALRRIGSFTWQGRDVGAWFVTIARNLIADHYKSSRFKLELTTDDVAQSGARLVAEGPESEVLDAMQNRVLLQAVRQLGPEQQECIVLRFLQGLSVAETSRVMGKNDGSIKALQYRAVKALGRLLPDGVEL